MHKRGPYALTIALTLGYIGAMTATPETIFASQGITCLAMGGTEARKYLDELATCNEIFKEAPYFYQPVFEKDRAWIEDYCAIANKANIFLIAFCGTEVVGFAHGMSVNSCTCEETKAPFLEKNLTLDEYYIVTETLIKQPYRGKGLFRCFVEYFEKVALQQNFSYVLYGTVRRPGLQRSTKIFRHFDYEMMQDFVFKYSWFQVDTNKEEANILDVWYKKIR